MGFEWDKGNVEKSRRKHGVTAEEAESVFGDQQSVVIADPKHSKTEKRFAVVGKSKQNRILFVTFTWRKGKIRIISARRMHGKEVKKYAKIKKNSSF